MKRIAQAIGDRLIGAPEGAEWSHLLRGIERGSWGQKIRALREIAARATDARAGEVLVHALEAPAPGLRRTAAHGLGLAGNRKAIDSLVTALERERCDEPSLAMSVAAVRLGLFWLNRIWSFSAAR